MTRFRAGARAGRFKPHFRHPRERHYRRPGGPWDLPSLDGLLTDAEPHPALLVGGDRRWSSAEVNDAVARLAGGLEDAAVGRGDVVAWQAANLLEVVLLYRACWRLGAVAAPLHHRAGPAEVEALVSRLRPSLTLSTPDLPLVALDGTVAIGGGDDGFAALLDGRPRLDAEARPTDPACILFTAGSTGAPKAVLHSHRTLGTKARMMVGIHGLGPDDAVLMPAPLAHISGLLNGLLVPQATPMKSVLMDRWDPDTALELIEAERITFMVGPPTFFVQMREAERFSPERVESLRLVSSGGAGVSPGFVEDASTTFGAVVKRTYGSTEAPTVATSYEGDDPGRARVTDGRAAGEVELRIVDPVRGADAPPGDVGELWVRGPEVCVGYLDAVDTDAAFAKGAWFRTGDLATLDEEGWLAVVGRLKDVIIRGGENIPATEVEATLETHPAVRQAAVVGEPDPRMGERVVAFVVLGQPFDLETCRAWFEEQGVAKFKTPERVVPLDEIPMLPAGKPDKAALRELLA